MPCESPVRCAGRGCDSDAQRMLRVADPAVDEAPPRQRTAQVIRLQTITELDVDPQLVLQNALDKKLKVAVVLGYTADGAEFFASSVADGADAVWLMERAKLALLGGGPMLEEID